MRCVSVRVFPEPGPATIISGPSTISAALPRIAWKAFAREQGLQVKQFSTPAGEELWLDFADAPEPGTEGKLSRMTRWVLEAEAQGLRYGLRLPDGELPAGNGAAQRDECLRRLALFDLSDRKEQA